MSTNRKLTWEDAEDIGIALHEKLPEADPLTIRFTDLRQWVTELEAAKVSGKGWAMPGANAGSAALDLARTVCRRAERRACALQDTGQLHNPEIVVYLNRLSDLLWVQARWVEARQP